MKHVDEGTLHALVDGQLPAEERRAVEAHLAACGACARQFAEATQLAHQAHGLLAMLDVERSASPIAAPTAPTVVPGGNVVPIESRRRGLRLRRLAVAASVLVVAGVSYRVGRETRVTSPAAAPPPAAARPMAVAAPAAPAAPAMDTQLLASAPLRSAEPRATGGPRATSVEPFPGRADAATSAPAARDRAAEALPVTASAREAVAPAAADGQAPLHSQSVARTQAPVEAAPPLARQAQAQVRMADAADAVDSRVAQAPMGASRAEESRAAPAPLAAAPAPRSAERARKAVNVMAGYTVVEQEVAPGRTQVRYAGTDGTILTYIVRAERQEKRAADSGTSYTVTPGSPENVVRWTTQGTTHELRGALRPDSLMKLAALLR